MSSQAALQIASSIQSKVGSSLLGVNSMLPPAEASAAILQAGGGSLGVFLLRDLNRMQEKTYECVEKVAHLLQSQLDIAEEAERRARDQAAELAKEKKPEMYGPPAPPGAGTPSKDLNDNLDDIEAAVNKGTIADLITGGLTAAMLAPGAMKNLGKGLGKKLLKGGIYGAIAGFVANPIIDYVDDNFDLELDQAAKDEIKLKMIGAGVGFGMFGIPGAIIGATVPAIAKVASYIGGSLNAEDMKDSDFAQAGIGSAAIAMFTASKLGGLFAGSAIPAVATFGGALASLPVIIGIGAAVAVGAGAMFIAKKVDEYQELTLQKLAKTTAKLDKEMGMWAAKEEEGLFERMGINLGNISAIGEAQVAAKEAFEQIGQDKDKFMASGNTAKLTGLVNAISNYSDDTLRTILMDKTKGENFFSTLENLKGIAASGGFGDESGQVFSTLTAMSDKIQNIAIAMLAEGKKSDPIKAAANNRAGNIRGQIEGGDQLENLPEIEKQKAILMEERARVEERLVEEQKKLEDMKAKGMKGDMNIFKKNEFELQEALVEKLSKKLVFQRNDPQNLENRIGRLDTKLQKFGTLNGLLYNLDQLREIMTDKELNDLIQMSATSQGSQFLNEQKETKKAEKDGSVIYQDNSKKSQTNNASQNNYVEKLNIHGDPYIAREGYSYGL